ncbi:uncharacterized protein LOC116435211 isoform X5 [Nomia melanderi]|nr:uncharacterized protein LOC116435211 isoform X5 [Nomia melanderi]
MDLFLSLLKTISNLSYASSTESEPMYNSDNADTYEKLIRSPSQAEYVQYINHRKDEESHYELWKQMLCEHSHISLKIKKQCGMTAVLTDDRVRYIYKPDSNNSHIPGIKFKITFIYIKLLRKWYISLGRSRVPNVINLRNKVREVLPSLNQRCGQPMTMQSMQNKVPGIGMMSAQTSSPMSYMSPTQTMQNNLMFTQMNPMAQGNMPQQINQVVLNQMGPITTGQMQQNMQAQMQNQLSDQINNQFGLLYISDLQTSMSQQMNLIAPGQLDPDQMQQQLNHMQRK